MTTSQTGFPVVGSTGAYRIVQVHTSTRGTVTRKRFAFCTLATPEQNAQGLYGLLEYHRGERDQVMEAARFASRMCDDRFIVIQESQTGHGSVASYYGGETIDAREPSRMEDPS